MTTAATAKRNAISAVASLISDSPSRTVTTRRGAPTRPAIAVAATGSVGPSTAPSTNATSHGMPTTWCATKATPTVVTSTSPTESSAIGRALKRRSRIEE